MDATMPRGCEWLIGETAAKHSLCPEQLSGEHRLIGRTADEFLLKEVLPALPDLEKKRWDVARALLVRAGSLGLIGVDAPEDVGGVGLDKVASIVVGESIGACASFATTFGAQSGLAVFPILAFGTPEQQQRYLPRILSGEIVGAYCLSETGSGSDALGARARATRRPDGSWTLSGEKMWITNGGFADLFIVFAKVDGEAFTAFLVERGFRGVSTGKEEHKMGLHGSSTTPVVLQDAEVPASNLLGEVGKGHKIAFNVLNYGRFKLAAMCTGGARAAFAEAVKYAAGRRQFGKPIASFGAIRHKLGSMASRIYGVESMLYRTAGLIDRALAGRHAGREMAAVLEEFAVEASILKIASSELTDFVVDEDVQIHGGNGYVSDYPAERRYRDARVNRIFEGTNEINRLVVPTQLVRRALKSGFPLIEAARQAEADLLSSAPPPSGVSPESAAVRGMKTTAVLMLGLAMRTFGEALQEEQEVQMLLADIVMAAFGSESVVLRARHAAAHGHPAAALHGDAASVWVHDAALSADAAARTALGAMVSGDALRTSLAALRRTLAVPAVNTVAARRRLSDAALESGRYVFSVV